MEALEGNGKDQRTAIVYSRRKDIKLVLFPPWSCLLVLSISRD
jgi:hypothetical protein